jgi:hypothetical protein
MANLPVQGKLSGSFTGKLAQLNISVLLIFAAALTILFLCIGNKDPYISYGGSAVAVIIICVTAVFAGRYHSRQERRPTEGQPATFAMETRTGEKLTVKNPPDSFFEQSHVQAVLRSLLVGYDENLTADGEVIGKAADENYRLYSEAEKKAFTEAHRQRVRGQRARVATLLEGVGPDNAPDAPAPQVPPPEAAESGETRDPPT